MKNCELEPGSFRDRESRIFYRDGAVFRGLSEEALKEWELLFSTKFFPRLMDEGKLVYTERVSSAAMPDLAEGGEWAAVLRHHTVPFISYPYEWSFGMLKDAALLQLELLLSALDEDMIPKDSSAFNFQWIGARPVFIDITSFEKIARGEPWVGYRQFCEMFLYPLFLQAYKDVAFQPWLRGSIDGIQAEQCSNIMSARDLLRPGVFMHVYLQNKMQAMYSRGQENVKEDLRGAGFNKDLIKTNARRLVKIIRALAWKRGRSVWSDYVDTNSYTDADSDRKAAFVRDAVVSRPWSLVWDLGCNTGTFSRIAAENASYVVAMDADHLAVERFYQALKSERNTTILPLRMDVVDASPSLGWRGLERKTITDRGKPDLTLCLALIHHMVIARNIPLKESVDWLASLGSSLVIEFITKEDSMVRRLLQNKEDNYKNYDIHHFEMYLGETFKIVGREKLQSGTRILYFASAKS